MKFDSLSALIYMDGHGVYVWTTFVVTFVVFFTLIVVPLLQQRAALKKLKRKQPRNMSQSGMQEKS